MNASIITIGDEILIGQVIDTNSAWMAQELNLLGVKIKSIHSIADNKNEIIQTINTEINSCELVLVTGGLGPTNDDITKHTLAGMFQSSLVLHTPTLEHIRQFITSKGARMNPLNTKQAELPDKCHILHNQYGTAMGMKFKTPKGFLVSMPGVPHEMKHIMQTHVLPTLKSNTFIQHRTIHLCGIPEAALAEKLATWESTLEPDTRLAYLPAPGIIRLRVTMYSQSEQELTQRMHTRIAELLDIVHPYHFGYDDTSLAKELGKILLQQGHTIATAESCTGGSIASAITSVPGASGYFKGAVIAYSNEIKENILKVNKTDLNTHGAVSQTVVEQMAVSVKKMLRTNISIAVSGIAGPGGGTPDKPLGTTWIAWALPDNTIHSRKFELGDVRERNILKTVQYALFEVIKACKKPK